MNEMPEPETAARRKAEAHLAAAKRCYRDKSLVEAIVEFQKAVDADPDFSVARDQLGYALQEKEWIEEDIPRMRAELNAPECDPTTEENLRERNHLGWLCYCLGRDEEASTEWKWVVNNGTGNAQKSARKRLRKYLHVVPITIAILAGGQSRRMGTDKAALEVEGVTLLERTVQLALAINPAVLVVGRACPAGWPLPGTVFLEDVEAGLGPAGGLATALRQAQTSVLALACDLPLLSEDALRWLIAQAEAKFGPSGLVIESGEGWEPLFSVYDLACLPLIEARLAAGRRSLRGVIEAGAFAFINAPDWVAAQLVNVNTPEQWHALQENTKHEKH